MQHLVNASDLDRWVKQADEYRDLYLKSEMELQVQAERYEMIIAELKQQIYHLSNQNASFSDPAPAAET